MTNRKRFFEILIQYKFLILALFIAISGLDTRPIRIFLWMLFQTLPRNR